MGSVTLNSPEAFDGFGLEVHLEVSDGVANQLAGSLGDLGQPGLVLTEAAEETEAC